MVLIFIILRVLFHFFLTDFVFRFCTFPGIYIYFFLGGGGGGGGVPGFFFFLGCSGMFRCTDVPGSSSCRCSLVPVIHCG